MWWNPRHRNKDTKLDLILSKLDQVLANQTGGAQEQKKLEALATKLDVSTDRLRDALKDVEREG